MAAKRPSTASVKTALSEEEGFGPVPKPYRNPRLLGQYAAEQILLGACSAGRLPHGWVIGGPVGIGKATLAYRFARFLLANGASKNPNADGTAGGNLFGDALINPAAPPTSLVIDPEHHAARLMSARSHPDLIAISRIVDPKTGKVKSEIPVDEVRKIGTFLRKTASEGGYRIAIVDGAESLNRNGQNAILKVLEEPPERAVLILATSRPGSLLPTIRSRTRRLILPPLDEEQVIELLEDYAPELAGSERAALAALSEGSIGKALQLNAMGGMDVLAGILDLLSEYPKQPLERIHKLSGELAPVAQDAAYQVFRDLLVWVLARLVRQGARGQLAADPLLGQVGTGLVSMRGLDHWFSVWEKTTGIFARTDGANLDRKQALLAAFATIYAN